MKETMLLDKFKKEYYPFISKKILELSLELFQENVEDIKKQIYLDLDFFSKNLQKIHEENDKPIMQIVISVPYLELCSGVPCYIFEAYNDIPFVNDPISSERFPIPWKMISWSEQINTLFECVTENEMQMYIKRPCIEALHRKSISRYLLLISAFLKRLIKDVEAQSFYNDLKKADIFTITFGEYYDWQNVIFKERVCVDVLGGNNDDLSYMKFNHSTHENRTFKSINLNDTVFYKCEFKDCTFDIVTLYNAEFIKCNFENCLFNHVKLYGALFQSCSLLNIEMTAVKTNSFNEKPKDFEFCAEFKIVNSDVDTITFKNSDLVFAKIINSNVSCVKSFNSELSDSVSKFVAEMEN